MFSFQVTLSSVAVLNNDLYSIASSAACSDSLGRRLRATFVVIAGGPILSIVTRLLKTRCKSLSVFIALNVHFLMPVSCCLVAPLSWRVSSVTSSVSRGPESRWLWPGAGLFRCSLRCLLRRPRLWPRLATSAIPTTSTATMATTGNWQLVTGRTGRAGNWQLATGRTAQVARR